MSEVLRCLSPAKLNLFLHITGRRADGYHELQTLFQLLEFGDYMEFRPRRDRVFEVHCEGLDIPERDNLVYHAAETLRQYSGYSAGISIMIEKNIPHGGGLGGGSSNAATTLLVLNHLWKLQLDKGKLAELGATLGADIPVFVHGQSSWAEGIGDKLTSVALNERWYLVLKPSCTVATGQIFSNQELTRNTTPLRIAAFFEQGGHNDCEPVVKRLYPAVRDALDWLQNHAEARLTGTGACVFAAFDERQQADSVYSQVPPHIQAFVARGVNRSPVHNQLELK